MIMKYFNQIIPLLHNNNNNNNNCSVIRVLFVLIIIICGCVVQLKSVPLLNATDSPDNGNNGNVTIISTKYITNISNTNNNDKNKSSNGNTNNASSMYNNNDVVYGNGGAINTHLNHLKQDVFDLNDKKSLEQYLRAWTKYHTPTIKSGTTLQPPHQHFYTHFNQYGIDNSTLSIYLSFAIGRLNRRHQHHYFQFRHYFHNWQRQEPQTIIKSNEIAHCRHSDDGTYLCPLNTRPLCTVNGTIYCVTAINKTRPCRHIDPDQRYGSYPHHDGLHCVRSLVPCIIASANVDVRGIVNRESAVKCQADKGMWMERIVMPCLTNVVVDDEYESEGRHGHRTTLVEVSGTFVLVAAVPPQERTFCATIIADFVPIDS